MRAVSILVALSGCIYFDSDDAGDGPAPQPEPPPIEETLPAGIWEPAPGAHVYAARVAADGTTLWWVTGRREYPGEDSFSYNDVWLHATSSTGDEIKLPQLVAPRGDASWAPDVVVTLGGLYVQAVGEHTLLRRFTHKGLPHDAPYALSLGTDANGNERRANASQLVATADGRAQYVATTGYDDNAEVAVIDLDGDGAPSATTWFGPPDTMEPGSASSGVSAAARPDGSTIVAWERFYNGCISTTPSQARTASIEDGVASPVTTVLDLPESEFRPAVATNGSGAYIAWQTPAESGGRLSLARYAEPTTVIAQLGDTVSYESMYAFELSAPDRGAFAWLGSDDKLHVQAFADRDGMLLVGAPVIVSPVGTWPSTIVDLVHVGEDRFVLAWIEAGGYVTPRARDRLFATELDLADAVMRPAPPLAPSAAPDRRPLRCP